MACARAILASSAFLPSSGPITDSSHCICLLMALSLLSLVDFFPLPFGSAACATGDSVPKRQEPARAAAQTNDLDRIEQTSTWGWGRYEPLLSAAVVI